MPPLTYFSLAASLTADGVVGATLAHINKIERIRMSCGFGLTFEADMYVMVICRSNF